VTSRYTSTVLSTVASTIWTTTTGYTTVTTTSRNGVATSTVYVTSTKFERRADLLPRQTDVKREPQPVPAPEPTSPPVQLVGSTPRSDILGRALAKLGLLEKRTSTAIVYLVYTSTTYSYSYTTSFIYRYSTSTTGTTVVRTSTIFDGASTTVTTTSIITFTTRSISGETPTPNPVITSTITLTPITTLSGTVVTTSSTSNGIVIVYPTALAASSDPGGLSTSATIGIGVGASVGALVLISALAAFFLLRRRRNSAAGGSDGSTIITAASGPGGGGGGVVMTESRTMSPATVSAAYPSGMTWADGKDVRDLATPSPLGTSPPGHGGPGGYFAPWPAPPTQPQPPPPQQPVQPLQPYAAAGYRGQSELSAVRHSYGPSELPPQDLQELAAHQQHQQYHGSIPYATAPAEAPSPPPPGSQDMYRPVPVRYGHQQQGSGGW